MAHNRWLVDFRFQQVPSVTYGWSAGHGGCSRDRRSHPEGGCAYGSGAAGRAGPAGTISGVRWDDARYDNKGGAEGAQPRGVSALDSEPRRLHHGSWPRRPDGQRQDAHIGYGEGAVSRFVIGKAAGDACSRVAAVSRREHGALLSGQGKRHHFRVVRISRPRVYHQSVCRAGRCTEAA
jgi:hypothetical protein